MLDQNEIQLAIESTHVGVSKDHLGTEKALDYYVLTQYGSKYPILTNHEDEIFLWATSDHNLNRYLSSLNLEPWQKGRASQLTKFNNDLFLDALESTPTWKKSLKKDNRLKALYEAFTAVEKSKSKEVEMTLSSVSRILASAHVTHTVVSSDPLVVALNGTSELAKLIGQGSESDAKLHAFLNKYMFDILVVKEYSTSDSKLMPMAYKALLSLSNVLFPKPTLKHLSDHETKSYYTLISKYRALGRHDANKIRDCDCSSDAGSPLLELIQNAASNVLSREATLRKLLREIPLD